MFANMTNVVFQPSALELLRDSEYRFYQTGSRRLGGAKETSDYDFFVKNEPGVVSWLLQNGFTKLTNNEGYSLIPNTSVYRKHNVDVQVRSNAEAFERVNVWLEQNPKAHTTLKQMSGENRNIIWEFLLRSME